MKHSQINNCKPMVLFVLILLMIPMTGVSSQKSTQESAQKSAQESVQQVAVITVSEQVALIRQLLGTVFAPQTQTLSSQVAGVITSEKLGMGHQVTKGDVIVQLDDREAKAQLALAQAELGIAQIRVKQKQLMFDRVRETYNKKLASRADYDEADLELQQARSELLAFEAKSQLAKLNLEKHSIVAPFDGLLISNSPVVGKQLLPGENVVEMLNNNNLTITVSFSQEELSKLKTGLAQLVLQTEKSSPLSLLKSSPATRINSGMIDAEFSLPASVDSITLHSDPFYSGQTITLQLIENRMSVPDHIISEDYQGRYVLAVSDGKVARVGIDDLAVGQKVVVLGPNNLLPGDTISVLPVGDVL